MAGKSTLTYRTLRLAIIALGLACFHAYGAGPGGTGRVTTVGRTGGGGNSRVTTFAARQGCWTSRVETFAGQRARVASAARPQRTPVASRGRTSDVARAVARTQQRMAAKGSRPQPQQRRAVKNRRSRP